MNVPGELEHHDSPDLEHWLEKQNRYTTAEAITAFKNSPLADRPLLLGTPLRVRHVDEKGILPQAALSVHPVLLLQLPLAGAWRAGWVGYAWARLRSDVMRLVEYKRKEMEITERLPAQRFYGPGKPDPRVRQYD